MPDLLSIEGLSVDYGLLRAIDDVDLVVPDGCLVALLGPNGAGKTTLLKTIAGLETPAAGNICLQGTDVGGFPPHERARRGVVLIPEGAGVFPTLTVADNLRIALADSVEGVARVTDYFPFIGERREQLAGTLSGGEQRMLALARAVGSESRLLMADELSLGLAPVLVKTITDALQRLHEDGRTILLVEQYAAQALRIADFVYILNRGRCIWAGEPQELMASKVLVESYLGTV